MDTSESQSTRFFIESNIKIPDDPFYISMTAIEEETYYLQFDIGSAIRVSSVSQSKGGLLCEELKCVASFGEYWDLLLL